MKKLWIILFASIVLVLFAIVFNSNDEVITGSVIETVSDAPTVELHTPSIFEALTNNKQQTMIGGFLFILVLLGIGSLVAYFSEYEKTSKLTNKEKMLFFLTSISTVGFGDKPYKL